MNRSAVLICVLTFCALAACSDDEEVVSSVCRVVPSPVDFGVVPGPTPFEDSVLVTQDVTVWNDGNETLTGTLELMVAGGPGWPEFELSPPDGEFTIAPGASQTFALSITTRDTTEYGSYSGVLQLGTPCGTASFSALVAQPPSDSVDLLIRSGTWSIMESGTYTGDDSCLARPQVVEDTTEVLCDFELVEGDIPFPIICYSRVMGDSIEYVCRVSVNLGICTQIVDLIGSGIVTETSFDLTSVLTTYLEPAEGVTDSTCEFFYGQFVDDCALEISLTGTWLSSDGADTCPPAPGNSDPGIIREQRDGIPLDRFLVRLSERSRLSGPAAASGW